MADEMTPDVAVAVLNAAMKGANPDKPEEPGMYPEGAIPEKDADKVAAANQIIELAEQARVVADQVGHVNVPMWPVVERVLRAAGRYPSTNGAAPSAPDAVAPGPTDPGPAAMAQAPTAQPAPLPPAAAGLQEAADVTGVGMVGSSFNDPPGVEYRAEPGGDGPVQVANPPTGQPVQETLPPAAAEPPPSGPQNGQRWLDANGGEWDIITYAGGPQLEARSVETGEPTVLPAGFLKQPSPNQPAPAAPTPPPVQEVAPSPPTTSSTPQAVSSSSPPSSPSAMPGPAVATSAPSTTPAAASGSGSSPAASPPASASGTSTPSSPPEPVVPTSPQSPAQSREEVAAAMHAQAFTAPVDDDEGDEKYGNLLAQVTADYQPIGMPVPMDLERPTAAMPDDLTGVDDISARAYHSQFNALAARARYLHGLEAAKARACERVYKFNLKGAMRVARQELGQSASVTEVQQLAEDNELVEPWMRRRDLHADRAEAYNTFLKFYSEDVVVLSRDWTMRDKEERGS